MATESKIVRSLTKWHKELAARRLNMTEQDQSLWFVPLRAVGDILTRERLEKLVKTLQPDGETCTKSVVDHILGNDVTDGEGSRPGRLTIVAILVYLVEVKGLETLIHLLLEPKDDLCLPTDDQLPLSEGEAVNLFGDNTGRLFTDTQHRFCAIILHENEDTVCEGSKAFLPLPFEGKPSPINGGSSGDVSSVIVAPNYWKYEGMSNDEPKSLAQKVFKERKHFETEKENLRKLKNARTKHENVMLDWGSLELKRGDDSEYILFYPLAQEDLHTFLHATVDASEGRVSSMSEKADYIEKAADLVGGLVWLHDAGPSLCIYHFDIKPDNILLVPIRHKGVVWKLTDFDLARPKENRNPRLRSAGSGSSSRYSSAPAPRCSGTFQAPEVRDQEGNSRIGEKSDVWSIGCIIMLVLAYLDGGVPAVLQFNEDRCDNGYDYFYSTSDGGKAVVSAGVVKWFTMIRQNAWKRSDHEGRCVDEAVLYLQENVFVTDREQRCTAKELEKHLWRITEYYRNQATLPPETAASRRPSMASTASRLSSITTKTSSTRSAVCSKICQMVTSGDHAIYRALRDNVESFNAICQKCQCAPLHKLIYQCDNDFKSRLLLTLMTGPYMADINVNVKDNGNRTPFMLACDGDGDAVAVGALLDNPDTDVPWEYLIGRKKSLSNYVWQLIEKKTKKTDRERPKSSKSLLKRMKGRK